MATGGDGATVNTAVSNMLSTAYSAIESELGHQQADDSADEFRADLQNRYSMQNLYTRTLGNFTRQGSAEGARRRGRPTAIVQLKVFLLEEPLDKMPDKREQNRLTSLGFGSQNELHKIKKCLCLTEFQEFICSIYPGAALGLTGFSLGKAGKSRKIFPVLFETMAQVKKEVGKGRLLIIPNQRMSINARPQPQDMIQSSTSTLQEDVRVTRAIRNQQDDEYLEALANDQERARPQPRDMTQSSTSTLQEDVRVTRAIRNQQDDEYLEALANDQERARDRQIKETYSDFLSKLKAERRERVPSIEPRDGIQLKIRLPEGDVHRHFSVDDDIQRLMDVIGSQDSATEMFLVHGVGPDRSAILSSVHGSLRENGITSNMVLFVNWLEPDDEHMERIAASVVVNHTWSNIRTTVGTITTVTSYPPTPITSTVTTAVAASSTPTETLPVTSNITVGTITTVTSYPPTPITSTVTTAVAASSTPTETLPVTSNITTTPTITSVPSSSRSDRLHIATAALITNDDDEWQDLETPPAQIQRHCRRQPQLRPHHRTLRYDELIDVDDKELALSSDSESETDTIFDTRATVAELLCLHRSQYLDHVANQPLKVSRHPSILFNQSMLCFARKRFDAKKTLKVQFVNEAGIDEGGLRREYLEILLRQLVDSQYLSSSSTGYRLADNTIAEMDGKFSIIGKMVATILLQGGPAPRIFDHNMVQYGIKGIEGVDLSAVEDSSCRRTVEKVLDSAHRVSEIDGLVDIMDKAGIRIPSNDENRQKIARALTWQYSYIKRNFVAYNQFWEGAEDLRLTTLLKSHPESIEQLLCRGCGKDEPLTADLMSALIHISEYGEAGSNGRQASELIFGFLDQFLYEVEQGEVKYLEGEVLTLGQVLRFLTGISSIPPGGLSDRIVLHFTRQEGYPTCSTCAFILTVPLHLTQYSKFKEDMTEAIVSGQGFGNV